VNYLRLFLNILVWTIVVAAVLVVLAFVPNVQTWLAQFELDRQPGLKGSVGSVSAGLGEVDVEDLHLEADGAVLTLPSLQAELPIATAAWHRELRVRSLVAKGWKLDLSHFRASAPTPAVPDNSSAEGPADQTPAAVTEQATQVFRDLIHRGELPLAGSWDGIDLDGDVLFVGPGKAPGQLHLVIKGGGLAAGHEGSFALNAAIELVDPQRPVNGLLLRGRLTAALATPRSLGRLAVQGDMIVSGEALPTDLTVTVDLGVTRSEGVNTYSLGVSRGARRVIAFVAHSIPAKGQLAGTWKLDVQDSEVALFAPDHPLPSFTAAGEGGFETDRAFTRVHALGRLHGVASRLETLAAPLGRLGTVAVDADFDLARVGTALRIDRLSVAVAGPRPLFTVRSRQSFEWELPTGSLTMSQPDGEWLDASIQALPLSWLPDLPDGLVFSGGDAAGECVVRSVAGGFALRPQTPLTAAGVSIQHSGRVLARGLDLTLALVAGWDAQGWHAQGAPLGVSAGGSRLATIDWQASAPAGADQPIAIAGKWTADLDAMGSHSDNLGGRHLVGHSAAGDFSFSTGATPKGEGKVTVTGHDPRHTATVNVSADVDGNGMVNFKAPLKFDVGSGAAEMTAEGSWTREAAGPHFDFDLTGKHATWVQMRSMAAPLLAASGGSWPRAAAQAGAPAPRDAAPFWGRWTGRVTLGFDQFTLAGHDFGEAGGSFDFDHGSLRLMGARGDLPHHSVANLEGSITFDPAAARPYRLKAAAEVTQVEAAPLFGKAHPDDDPVVEGRFTVDTTATSEGKNAEDLVRHLQEEYRVKSTTAILRLLKTNIADAIPEVSTPVADTLGTVGSVVGSFLGRETDPSKVRENPISKTAQAVLDFIDQVSEFGCDQMSATITQGPDRVMRLTDLTVIAADEHLTGSGQIAFAPGKPLAAQALRLDLQFGAKGQPAKLLTTAALLSAQKDPLGYALLNQPIHFGGTLAQIDDRQWRDLLAKAAVPPPGKQAAK